MAPRVFDFPYSTCEHELTRLISSAVDFFMGGVLMIIGGILEWVLGNSFAAVASSSFAIPGQAAQTGIDSQRFNAVIGKDS
jgi:hypothetical protein